MPVRSNVTVVPNVYPRLQPPEPTRAGYVPRVLLDDQEFVHHIRGFDALQHYIGEVHGTLIRIEPCHLACLPCETQRAEFDEACRCPQCRRVDHGWIRGVAGQLVWGPIAACYCTRSDPPRATARTLDG